MEGLFVVQVQPCQFEKVGIGRIVHDPIVGCCRGFFDGRNRPKRLNLGRRHRKRRQPLRDRDRGRPALPTRFAAARDYGEPGNHKDCSGVAGGFGRVLIVWLGRLGVPASGRGLAPFMRCAPERLGSQRSARPAERSPPYGMAWLAGKQRKTVTYIPD